MRTISLSVSESDYATFQRAAREQDRPAAELIREAMALYREVKLEARTPLADLPSLAGHRLVTELPSRAETYDEAFAGERSPVR
jgi:hypothetical protein